MNIILGGRNSIAYGEEGVWDIHANIHGVPNQCQVDQVTPADSKNQRMFIPRGSTDSSPNEPESYEMVCDEFVEVLSRFFEFHYKHNKLLTPICSLH